MADPSSNNDAAAAEVISETELKEAEQYLGRENFIKMHKTQFMAMRLPASLMNIVYAKFLAEQFDALESFEVQYVEDEGFRMVCKKEGGLKAGQDVFILDHLWTTSVDKGLKQLQEIDGLVDRLWTLADMDFRLETERQEKRAAAAPAVAATPAAAAPAVAAAAAATPAAAAAPLEIDEDSLCTIMSEAHVSRDRALEAFTTCKGDLIQSIVWCAGESDQEKSMKAAMEQMAESQAEAQAAEGKVAEDADVPFDSSSLSVKQKAELLWPWLFRAGLVGSYFTTLQNDVSSLSLKSEDVQSTLYVNDEVGSAVGQAYDANNANAIMAPLVAVTLGGIGFSLLWTTKDLAEGDELLIPRRAPIRLAGVPWSGQA